MVYRRYGTRKNGLKSYTARKGRRRTSVSTRAKYQAPTARNQQKQIRSLAWRVAKNTRFIANQKVYTDYQWGDALTPSTGIAQALNSGTWYGFGLTDFARWLPCLRQDGNVFESSKTYCVRMQLNCRVDIGDVDQLTYINIFVVSPRRDAVDVVNLTAPPLGSMTQLSLGQDFIENSQNQGAAVRLNSGRFKVHAAKYVTLTPNAPSEPLPTGQAVGNSFSTWRKWQWNVPLKFTVRNPSNRPWHDLIFEDMAYYQRFYLLAYSTNIGGVAGPRLDSTILSTAINFS